MGRGNTASDAQSGPFSCVGEGRGLGSLDFGDTPVHCPASLTSSYHVMSHTTTPPSCTSGSRPTSPASFSSSGSSGPVSKAPPSRSTLEHVENSWDKFLKEDLKSSSSGGSAGDAIRSGYGPLLSARLARRSSVSSSSCSSWEKVSDGSGSHEYSEVDSDPENDSGDEDPKNDLSHFDNRSPSRPGNEPYGPSRGYGLYSTLTKMPSLWHPQRDSHPFMSQPASLAGSNPSTSTPGNGAVSSTSIFTKAVSRLKGRMSDPEGTSKNGGSGTTGATGKGGKPRWYPW
ncbi:hypothetical protein DB88DRAFT_478450 [Papiliotrema laurentii]|uniref:Uncharacterized protein n=1 Tax=Papiliotrema laurentii TaxID=5418 RepID=A0AAD9FWI2_PAPLA|nr:hypothetical protein DB88DRAFT_478450 [Papiliotrema laurentii]